MYQLCKVGKYILLSISYLFYLYYLAFFEECTYREFLALRLISTRLRVATTTAIWLLLRRRLEWLTDRALELLKLERRDDDAALLVLIN